MTESPFGKVNPMDITDDFIKEKTPSIAFTGVPLDEFLETQTVLTRKMAIVTMAF